MPADQRAFQRGAVAYIDICPDQCLRPFEVHDVARINCRALGSFDPRGDTGTSHRVHDRKRREPKGANSDRLLRSERDASFDRQILRDLVRDRRCVDRQGGSLLQSPRMVRVSVRDEDGVRRDVRQKPFSVLAEVAEQAKARRLDDERGVTAVRGRLLLHIALRAEEVEAHAKRRGLSETRSPLSSVPRRAAPLPPSLRPRWS